MDCCFFFFKGLINKVNTGFNSSWLLLEYAWAEGLWSVSDRICNAVDCCLACCSGCLDYVEFLIFLRLQEAASLFLLWYHSSIPVCIPNTKLLCCNLQLFKSNVFKSPESSQVSLTPVAVIIALVCCVLSLLRDHTGTVLYIFDHSANTLNTTRFLLLAVLLEFSIWVLGSGGFLLALLDSCASFPCVELVGSGPWSVAAAVC